MAKKDTLPEPEDVRMVSEPVACLAISQPVMQVNLPYDIDQLRARLMEAADDARQGRVISCDEVHSSLEQKYPWLCD